MDRASTHGNNPTNDRARHRPQTASFDSLPQEIQDMILPSLTLHDLTVCVRVCQRWWAHFNPVLWAELHLGRQPGQEADGVFELMGHEREKKNGSGDGVQRRRRAGYARFKESAEAGALCRSGAWVKVLDTTCCSIVDLLMKFGAGEGEGVEVRAACTGLRNLQVVDAPCPETEVWSEEAKGQVVTLPLEDGETEGEEEDDDEKEEDDDTETDDTSDKSERQEEKNEDDETDDTSDESGNEELSFRDPGGSNDSRTSKGTRVVVTATPPPVVEAWKRGVETNAILALLRQSRHLTILKLGGEMMLMVHDLRFLILDAVPATIEKLELWDWRPACRKQEEYLSHYMYPTYQQPDLLPILPYLTRLVLGRCAIRDDAALNRLLKRCPHLEALGLHNQEDWPSKAYQGLAATIREFCKKVTGLFLVNCSLQSEEDLCLLMEACRKSGLRDFGYPCPPECKSFFAEKAARALLDHCETLENVRLDGCAFFPSKLIQKLLCSARRLKRFDAMSRFRFNQMNVVLDAQDISQVNEVKEGEEAEGGGEGGWVCLGLETFKCQIGGVPRPDVKFRTNGRPLTDPLHTSSTLQQSLDIQQKIYTQLGRLTQLRELVLGHHELNMNYMMFLNEMDTEGEYYDFDNPNQDVQGGYQYACLDMKLESGMAILGACKELRRCSVEAMAVGFFEDAEQEWMKKAWRMLDWGYRDFFWSELGFADSYY